MSEDSKLRPCSYTYQAVTLSVIFNRFWVKVFKGKKVGWKVN